MIRQHLVLAQLTCILAFSQCLPAQTLNQIRLTEPTLSADGDYRTAASGSWKKDSTWARFVGGAWITPATPPDSGAGVITIRSGHVVTINSSVVYDQVTIEGGAQVTVASGTSHTLADGPGTDLTISGTWINQGGTWSFAAGAKWMVNDGGVFVQNTTSAISTALSKATLSRSSTFTYRGGASLSPTSSFSGRTYGNLLFDTLGGSWSCSVSGSSPLVVNGNLVISQGVRWNTGAFSGSISIQGTTTVGGEWSGSGVTGQGTHTFGGAFNVRATGRYALATSGNVQGSLIFQGDVTSHGAFALPSNRAVVFSGLAPQSIGGSVSISFSSGLKVNNTAGIALNCPISVEDTLEMGTGNLLTGSHAVTLGTRGILIETSLSMVVGKILTTRALVRGVNESFGNIGIELQASGVDPGLTAVARVTGSSSRLGGAIPILRYFDLAPTVNAGLDASVRFRYLDSELNGAREANLRLFRSSDAGATWTNIGGSDDPARNIIAIDSIDQLSTVTAGEPIPSPTISGIAPSFAEPGSSTDILITGTGFVPGLSSVSFSNSGILMAAATITSSTQIAVRIAVSSTAAPGYSDVTVANSGVGTCTLPGAFEVRVHLNPVPLITSVIPSIVVRGESLSVTLHGRGFVHRLTSVSFGDSIVVQSSSVVDDATLIARIIAGPGTSLGSRSISVENPAPGGGISVSQPIVEVLNPVPLLSTVSPTLLVRGESVWLTLKGAKFVRDTSAVSFGEGIEADSLLFQGPSCLMVKVLAAPTAGVGSRPVVVSNKPPGGGSHSLIGAVSIINPAPTILGLVPDSGFLGRTSNVVLSGTGFLRGVTTVRFGNDLAVDSTIVLSSGQLRVSVTIPVAAAPGPRDISVINEAPGGGIRTLTSGFRVLSPVPIVEEVIPSYCVVGETTAVTLRGTNFIPGLTRLDFGAGCVVQSLVFNSLTEIVASVSIGYSPVGGVRDVIVLNPSPGGGTARLAGAFTLRYPVPALSNLSSTLGARGSTFSIMINGSHFIPGVTNLSFGEGVAVNSISVNSPTCLFASLSIGRDARLGDRDVLIVNESPGGGSMKLPGGFKIQNPLPVLDRISPPTVAIGDSTSLTLTGANFLAGVSGVEFGEGIDTIRTRIDSLGNHIVAGIRVGLASRPGERSVTVRNGGPGGGAATLTNGLQVVYPVPTITNVKPAGGERGQTFPIVISGYRLIPNATTLSLGANTLLDSISIRSPIEMTARLIIGWDAATGPRSLSATNPTPGGGIAELVNAFTVINPAPSLVRLDPSSGTRGKMLTVGVWGENFHSGCTSISFGDGVSVYSFVVDSPSHATAEICVASDAASGTRDVAVTNVQPGGGSTVLIGVFAVTNPRPTFKAIIPVALYRGQSLDVSVSGTDFIPGITTINLGAGLKVKSTEVRSSSQLCASIEVGNDAATGTRSVAVQNAGPGGGADSAASALLVLNPSPTIRTLTPREIARGQSHTVVVTGSNLVPGATAFDFGEGIVVDSIKHRSLTEIAAYVSVPDTSAIGFRNLQASIPQPGGGKALVLRALNVVNPTPTITEVIPSSVLQGDSIELTIQGTGFLSGVSSLFLGEGVVIRSLTVRSPTTIKVSINVLKTAIPGACEVTVSNPSPVGGTARASSFSIIDPVPILSSLQPRIAQRGHSLKVVFSGANFSPLTTSVNFGSGIVVDSVRTRSSCQIDAFISVTITASAGTRNVSATNACPGGGTATLAGVFEVVNPQPTISNVAPAVCSKGRSFRVVVTGSGFIQGVSSISMGSGVTIDSTVVMSTSQIEGVISVFREAVPGFREVVVSNQGPGGGSSSLPGLFAVHNPAPTISSALPRICSPGRKYPVIICGSDFLPGVTTADFGPGITVDSVAILSQERLLAYVAILSNAPLGSREIAVVNASPGGGKSILTSGFLVSNPTPVIAGMIPDSAAKGRSVDFVLLGSGFTPGATTVKVGNDVIVSYLDTSSDTLLKGRIELPLAVPCGPRSITVANASGNSSSRIAFNVVNPLPTVEHILPALGVPGQELTLTISGANFLPGQTAVSLGSDVEIRSVLVSSERSLTAEVEILGNAKPGPRNVAVTNSPPGGGTAILASTFVIDSSLPVPERLSVSSGMRGRTLAVALFGSNFIPGRVAVRMGDGITIDDVTVVNSHRIHMNISITRDAITGPRDLMVSLDSLRELTSVMRKAFTVLNPPPTLSSLSPEKGKMGQGVHLILRGGDFLDSVSTLDLGAGVEVDSIAADSTGTQLIARVKIGMKAKPGTRDVVVMNAGPGGGKARLKKAFSIENPSPKVFAVNPSFAIKGRTTTLHLKGEGFVGGVTSVNLGQGTEVTYLGIGDETELEASCRVDSSARTGLRDISVTNSEPGGGVAIAANALTIISDVVSVVHRETDVVPEQYVLSEAFPNPFNPRTAISYQLLAKSFVSLRVFDQLGREIASLVNGEQAAGVHRAWFDASNVTSGVYFVRLVAEPMDSHTRFLASKKIVLVR